MPTITQRIESIIKNQKKSCVEKMEGLTNILIKNPSGRIQAMKAMSKVIPDLPEGSIAQSYIQFVEASDEIMKLAISDSKLAPIAMKALAAMNQNLTEHGFYTRGICNELANKIVEIANVHDKKES